MYDNQERELKIILTQDQFEKILHSYDFEEPVTQINTYYDTADESLKKEKSALRIRQIGDQNILTVKKPKDEITKYEYEFPVSENSITIDDLLPSEKDHLSAIISTDEPYYPTVTFMTTRYNLKTPHAVISLDQTEFRNSTDYELEYEYLDNHDGISRLNEFLKPAGITYKENGPSKLARAMKDRLND